jgi:hypothetical protein
MTDTMPQDAPSDLDDTLTTNRDPLEPDPTAPYGRTDDGVLIDRNGKRAPYGLTKSGLRKDHAPRKRKPPTPGQKAHAARPSGRTITNKRRTGLLQLTDMPKGILLGLGYKADNEALLADAVTLDMHAAPVCDAIAQLAEDNDRLALVIDRVIEVGPLAQIGMVVGALAAQIARNHNAMPAPVAAMLGGSHDPAELAAVARGTMEQVTHNGAAPQPPAG